MSPSAKCTGQWPVGKVAVTSLQDFWDFLSGFAVHPAEMSSAANSFLRLNSTVSQPGSPTSYKSEKPSLPASAAPGGTTGRCGGVFGRYLNAHPRFKKALGHIGLVILLGCYTAAGAAVSLQLLLHLRIFTVVLVFSIFLSATFYRVVAESARRAVHFSVQCHYLGLFNIGLALLYNSVTVFVYIYIYIFFFSWELFCGYRT